MSLDVLLINPPFRLYPPFKYKLIDPPRNLALLGAILRENGYSVEILDMPIRELDFESIAPTLNNLKPKIVGILNRSTYSFPIVSKVAKIVKDYSKDIVVVTGGTYVSYMPEDALKSCPFIDVIVIGEGEIPFTKLVHNVLANESYEKIEGLAFRKNDEIIKNGGPIPTDLSKIPLPAIDLLPIDLYVARRERYILELSRGCSNACPYCTSSFIKKNVRYRNLEQIINEIELAYKAGFRKLYFVDDVFLNNKELVINMCKEIVKRNINVSWPCMSRVDQVDEESLYWMKRAGCEIIAFGIETITEKTLKEIGKYDLLEQIQETFTAVRRHGIRALAFVMFGLPFSTFHDELNTIKFLSQLQPDAVGVFSFKPYPGTIYYSHPEKFGITITSRDLSRWSQLDEPTHETMYLTRDEIIECMVLCNYIFRTGGNFSSGEKYRRRRGVQVFKTKEGGILYNPYVPPEKRKTDMYLNCVKLTPINYQILYHLDGYHSLEDICELIQKLFNLTPSQARSHIEECLSKAMELDLIELIPDIMAGKDTLNREQLIDGGGLV